MREIFDIADAASRAGDNRVRIAFDAPDGDTGHALRLAFGGEVWWVNGPATALTAIRTQFDGPHNDPEAAPPKTEDPDATADDDGPMPDM